MQANGYFSATRQGSCRAWKKSLPYPATPQRSMESGRNHSPTPPCRNGLWSLVEITALPCHAATVYGVWQKSLIFTNSSTVQSVLYSCQNVKYNQNVKMQKYNNQLFRKFKNRRNVKAGLHSRANPLITRVETRFSRVLTRAFHFVGLLCLYLDM